MDIGNRTGPERLLGLALNRDIATGEKVEAELDAFIRKRHDDRARARERLLSEFFRRALRAAAHVRRAPIDDARWRYTLEGLRGEAPVTVAAYAAALTHLLHPDEEAARELLSTVADERGCDAPTLWKCIDSFVRFAKERR